MGWHSDLVKSSSISVDIVPPRWICNEWVANLAVSSYYGLFSDWSSPEKGGVFQAIALLVVRVKVSVVLNRSLLVIWSSWFMTCLQGLICLACMLSCYLRHILFSCILVYLQVSKEGKVFFTPISSPSFNVHKWCLKSAKKKWPYVNANFEFKVGKSPLTCNTTFIFNPLLI
jgi:hypothetical protein